MKTAAKVAIALGGVAAVTAVVVASNKKKPKPPQVTPAEEPLPPDVIVAPPVPPPVAPPAPPPVVMPPAPVPMPPPVATPIANAFDPAMAARILLRWWSAEGEDLMMADEEPDDLELAGFPLDFGTQPGDLGNVWGIRQAWMGAAFMVLSGFDQPPVHPDKGTLDGALFSALLSWDRSQQLAPVAPGPGPLVVSATRPEPTQAPPIFAAPPAPAPVPAPQAPVMPEAPAPQPFGGPVVVPLPAPMPQPTDAIPVDFTAPLPEPAPPIFAAPPAPPAPVTPEPAPPLAPAPPPAPAAAEPSLVPQDTAALVQALLADEARPNWKITHNAVKLWQKSRGLTQDGKFGPKSALTVAREVGTVPIVRYWPSGSFPEGHWIKDYRAALLELAALAPEPRASQLRFSAERERGQGFGSKQAALPPDLQTQLVNA